jgi:hypothetical protein
MNWRRWLKWFLILSAVGCANSADNHAAKLEKQMDALVNRVDTLEMTCLRRDR